MRWRDYLYTGFGLLSAPDGVVRQKSVYKCVTVEPNVLTKCKDAETRLCDKLVSGVYSLLSYCHWQYQNLIGSVKSVCGCTVGRRTIPTKLNVYSGNSVNLKYRLLQLPRYLHNSWCDPKFKNV